MRKSRHASKTNVDRGLQAAVKAVGTRYRLARLLGLTPSSILRWSRVPAERVIEVERVTGVPREKLRPELYRP
ncbi:MAG: CI repressor [Chloroflexi bacterium]|nr:MAG: CI repressor [Chloroflexota bacterium]